MPRDVCARLYYSDQHQRWYWEATIGGERRSGPLHVQDRFAEPAAILEAVPAGIFRTCGGEFSFDIRADQVCEWLRRWRAEAGR
jgi:hypothetical protein